VIRIRALGPIELYVDGGAAPRELMWRKNLALLLYLSRSPDRRRSRDHLIGLLWGDKPDPAARHSLNEALRVIRKAAGDDVLESRGNQVVLREDALYIDVEELDGLLVNEDWEEAGRLMRGAFAEGFTVPDSSAFEDWLAAERRLWLDQMTDGLKRHAEDRLACGDGPSAQDAASRALVLDPFSDGAVRLAMLAAAIRGERAGALAVYDDYASRLAEELGIEPDPETEALADRIRNEREWRLPAPEDDDERWARRLPMVGREAELRAALHSLGVSFSRRSPAVLVVCGESGSGKTRFGEELVARARLEGAAVRHVRCVAGDREQPGTTLSALCHEGLSSGGEAAPTPVEDPAGTLVGLVRATTPSQSVLLWVDGAEDADADSLAALPSILRDCAGLSISILLSAATHPQRDEIDHLRARIGRDVDGLVLTLDPLDLSALEELAGQVFPELDVEAIQRLARRIQVDSAGLPLFAVELLTAVSLGLDLEDVGGAWPRPFQTMEQTYPGDLPDSVVAAIRIGYRRLSRPAQSVLAAASILDDRCDADLVRAATGLEGEALFEALDELEWNRWLVADQRGYGFVARIVRDVVARDMLTSGQRRRIQEAVAGT
jgi:DNA-binding SARP family transcriptional activator